MKNHIVYFLLFLVFIRTSAQDLMTPELLWKLGRLSLETLSPDGNTAIYGVTHYDMQSNKGTRQLYFLDLKTGTSSPIKGITGNASGFQYAPSGKAIGFLVAGIFYEMPVSGGAMTKILELPGGVSNVEYSPDGKYLLFSTEVKTGEQLTDKYPAYPKANAVLTDDLMYRHWNSYEDGLSSQVFYIPYNEGKVLGKAVNIMEGSEFESPTMPFGDGEQLAWAPDSKSIYYITKQKTGMAYAVSTNTDIFRYDLTTKTTTNITEGMMGYENSPAFSPDGSKLAWLSMKRDGYEADKNDLIVLDLKSGKKQNMTEFWDETLAAFKWSGNGKSIYFEAGKEATYQLFELTLTDQVADLKQGKHIRQITSGDHEITGMQVTGHGLLAARNDFNHAAELYLYNQKTGEGRKMTAVNDEIYAKIRMPKIEKRWIQTSDGKKMLTWVLLPPDFDRNKKYPALLYAQGGPQSAVSPFYSYRWNLQLMASKGYVVIAPNRRGLPTFGVKWNEDISKDWGGQAIQDYLSAVDEMKKEPYIDATNIGAVGASHGGYAVYMLAGVHENRFAAFISHCGMFDMKSWYLSTEELFFANWDLGGNFWSEPVPKSFTEYDPINYVDKWNTPIMIIHGAKDFRVPYNQGMEAFQAAKLKGIPSRFLLFPDEGHWVLSPQNSMVWHTEFYKWLDTYLKD